MAGRDFSDEQMIKNVVEAFDKVRSYQKSDLINISPELYFACAWLSARESVREQMRREGLTD